MCALNYAITIKKQLDLIAQFMKIVMSLLRPPMDNKSGYNLKFINVLLVMVDHSGSPPVAKRSLWFACNVFQYLADTKSVERL